MVELQLAALRKNSKTLPAIAVTAHPNFPDAVSI
jgi:hypothetical protein